MTTGKKKFIIGSAIALASVLASTPLLQAQSLTDYCNNPANASSPVCKGSNPTGGTGIFPAPSTGTNSGNQAAGGSQVITLPNPLGSTQTIPDLIGKIVDWLILISSIAVLPFMIIWGAYQMLMAGSNPEKVIEGRHTITWAMIGYGLLLLSKSIEIIIQRILTA